MPYIRGLPRITGVPRILQGYLTHKKPLHGRYASSYKKAPLGQCPYSSRWNSLSSAPTSPTFTPHLRPQIQNPEFSRGLAGWGAHLLPGAVLSWENEMERGREGRWQEREDYGGGMGECAPEGQSGWSWFGRTHLLCYSSSLLLSSLELSDTKEV